MKLYTEEQVKKAIKLSLLNAKLFIHKGLGDDKYFPTVYEALKNLTPIELPSDEEIIGRFMNWFLKHYSTATIDGMFGYVNSMEQEVTIREILDDYFNKEQILNQNK